MTWFWPMFLARVGRPGGQSYQFNQGPGGGTRGGFGSLHNNV
eukprot:CAMPEP_0205930782 /NCGR_PEP_ID=MMETSP1325-20131115/26092_1 /ASSEMBLY_ACC=CAM_ASM_000708 /TAXON_ID=236786 /ORGANISM="Florenciella sp., Strain RCC1007" /LENGTH=41 /DNA_ID= /DNA_START= /DNA_END= /DNA_ORIENTATION=